jgi:hypothetical protein
MKLSRRKQHIPGCAAAAARIGGMKVPIGASNVLARRKAKGAGSAVDGVGSTLEFEEHAHRCFIQVQMEAAKPERTSIFFVAESGTQTKRAEGGRPTGRGPHLHFPLELLLIARRARCPSGRLGRHHSAPRAAPDHLGRRRGLKAKPQKASAPPKVRIRRVVERVLLENPPMLNRAKTPNSTDEGGQIRDPELDFGFAMGAAAGGHN